MGYKSTINYFVFFCRILFAFVALFFLCCCLGIFPYFEINRWTNSLACRIITGAGTIWVIITTTAALYFRTKTISINGENIIIEEVFKRRTNTYTTKDIKKIKEGFSSDYSINAPVNANGIKIIFKNGDSYKFVYYDYLNLKRLSEILREIRKVEDVSFIG